MNPTELEPWIEKQVPMKLVDQFRNFRKEQLVLQKRVILKDHPSLTKITHVAGCDVSYFSSGEACAGIVVLEIPSLKLVEYRFHCYSPKIDYIPTFLAFREVSGLVKAYQKLFNKPDLIVVDGNGILHPHKVGLASHLGVLLNKPTIGIAKRLLLGHFDEEILVRNRSAPVMYNNQELGTAIVTDLNSKPIFISPGHLISIQTATSLILRYICQRLPEPIRLADKLTRDTVKDLE